MFYIFCFCFSYDYCYSTISMQSHGPSSHVPFKTYTQHFKYHKNPSNFWSRLSLFILFSTSFFFFYFPSFFLCHPIFICISFLLLLIIAVNAFDGYNSIFPYILERAFAANGFTSEYEAKRYIFFDRWRWQFITNYSFLGYVVIHLGYFSKTHNK